MTANLPDQRDPLARTFRLALFNDLRGLDVTETETEVVLTGIVRTYYLKQMAQELARPALGGRRLRNRVVVAPGR